MTVAPDILIVIATLVAMFSASSAIGSWAQQERPILSGLSLLIAIGLFVFVAVTGPGGFGFWDIPNAFISVAARILN